MPPADLIVTSRRVVSASRVGPASVLISGEKITAILPPDQVHDFRGPDTRFFDAGDHVVMPGLVDAHVHVNEPGRTEWEGFESAGRAAAAGGVTTVVVMPLNCTPAATRVDALLAEARAGACASLVDFGLWAGLVPGNADQLGPLNSAGGVGALGFKCFLVHSGVPDFPACTLAELERAMPAIARLDSVLLVHAEDPAVIDAARAGSGLGSQPRSYAAYLRSRPPESESAAVRDIIDLCRRTGCRAHIVHVAADCVLPLLERARRDGVRITAETCPHYLALSSEDIADGSTAFKCAPPIRQGRHREALWSALRSGVLDLIGSDHSPCPPDLKRTNEGDFAAAWGGIASLQLQLPVVWSHASARDCTTVDLARWMCDAPARLASLHHRKGRIQPGMDADLVVWEPDAEFTVEASNLHHRHKICPYDGRRLRGEVRATFLRGRQIFAGPGAARVAPLGPDGLAQEASGRWLGRSTT